MLKGTPIHSLITITWVTAPIRLLQFLQVRHVLLVHGHSLSQAMLTNSIIDISNIIVTRGVNVRINLEQTLSNPAQRTFHSAKALLKSPLPVLKLQTLLSHCRCQTRSSTITHLLIVGKAVSKDKTLSSLLCDFIKLHEYAIHYSL